MEVFKAPAQRFECHEDVNICNDICNSVVRCFRNQKLLMFSSWLNYRVSVCYSNFLCDFFSVKLN